MPLNQNVIIVDNGQTQGYNCFKNFARRGKLREVIGSNNINNNDDDKAANLYYGNHDVEDDFDYLNISQSTPKKMI